MAERAYAKGKTPRRATRLPRTWIKKCVKKEIVQFQLLNTDRCVSTCGRAVSRRVRHAFAHMDFMRYIFRIRHRPESHLLVMVHAAEFGT